MDLQKEGELFLAHMRSIGLAMFMFELDEDGNFDDMSMAYVWSAWQAAKAQSEKALLEQFEINNKLVEQIEKLKAKAQAVQETQQALNDRLLVKSIREHVESHIAEISVNDLFDKGWFAAMKCIENNIDMLEAQEQAND
ncbi:hypothetical protein [Acinetobacter towneri]|uniref:Uncharacterized protein n=1 Tax=Acinetobacter towneri TaxID=202956 RepID=A0ABX7TLC3_9GAMM|nr:hypothetical protein [Acinetobacter towneri]QTD63039.1 hypothetical protein J4G45_05815 [Acinetobacter towneri]